jgi:hypothetical protein
MPERRFIGDRRTADHSERTEIVVCPLPVSADAAAVTAFRSENKKYQPERTRSSP